MTQNSIDFQDTSAYVPLLYKGAHSMEPDASFAYAFQSNIRTSMFIFAPVTYLIALTLLSVEMYPAAISISP